MDFFRPEYWCGYPFPSPGDLLNPGIEPGSPALQADSLPAEPQGKPKDTGVGSLSLLQGIFLPQVWNQGLLHCRWILYQLCYQGSPTSVLFTKLSGWQFLLNKLSGWQFLLNSIKQWEIFPTQAWNLGLLHCRQILYLLSHQEAQSNGDKLIFKVQKSLIFLSSCYFPNVSHRKLHFRCTVV